MFLCSKHREQMATQSSDALHNMINTWVNKAVDHYQYQRWEFALPYIGCALETCWLLGQQQKDSGQAISLSIVEKSLCLAIYCHNILSHQQAMVQGESVLLTNWQWIMHSVGYENRPDFIKHCLDICQNNHQHADIIAKHTNWPFQPANQIASPHYH